MFEPNERKKYEEIVDAKLVAYTQVDPDYGIDLCDAQSLIAYCAKVSNPSSAKQEDLQNSDKLIKYLMKNSHWSPLEMVNAVLRLETTRDIGRQIIRHPTFRFQEFSQRYAAALTGDDQGIQLVLSEARLQDPKNRQNSIDISESDLETPERILLRDWWEDAQKGIADYAEFTYQKAIDKGLAKETARKILPEGLTTTTMFVNGSIRSWIHYADLRKGNGTQKEHVMIAKAAAKAITKIFPMMEEL
jgi:thymidylate synthase (FAD)